MAQTPSSPSATTNNAAKDDVVGANGDFNFTIADLLANDPGSVAKLNLASQFFFGNISYYKPGQLVNGVPTIDAQKAYLLDHGITANVVNGKLVSFDIGEHGRDFDYMVQTGNKGTWSLANVDVVGTPAPVTPIDPPKDPPVNHAPSASLFDGGSVKEDMITTGKVTATDVDGGALTYKLDSPVAGLTLDSNGNFTFDTHHPEYQHLAGNQAQSVTATYTVTDDHGVTSTSTISFLVIGENDAASSISGDTSGAVTEDAPINTVSGDLNNTDIDNAADAWRLNSGTTAHGSFTVGIDGKWLFTLDNTNAEVNALNAGQQLTDTFTVKTIDGTEQVVTVTINGATDNHAPVVTDAVTGAATEGGNVSTLDALANASDTDAGSTLSVIDVPNPLPPGVTFNAATHSFSLDPKDGAYDHLAQGITTPVTVNYTVTDEHGATTPASVSWTVTGTNDVPTVTGQANMQVIEGNLPSDISTGGQLSISDLDDGQAAFVTQDDVAGKYGHFSIDASGAWTYTANSSHNEFVADQHYTDAFDVFSADGTKTTVDIDIRGTDDLAVLSSAEVNLTEGNLPSDISASSQLKISDPDSQTSFVAQSDVAGTHGHFSIGTNGVWTYTANSAHDEFIGGNHYTEHFNVESTDGGHTAVDIDILGTNDAPVAVNDTGAVNEQADSTVPINNILGNLFDNDSDVDSGFALESFGGGAVAGAGTQPIGSTVSGLYGTLLLNSGGNWFYQLDDANAAVQALNSGETLHDVFNYTIHDQSLTDTAVIDVTINGTNDTAMLDGDYYGDVKEDTNVHNGKISVSGKVNVTDPDAGQSFFQPQNVQGTYGAFSVDKDGHWTYTADNGSAAIQHLGEGQSLSETFTVASLDGTASKDITVDIDGANDNPVLSGSVATLAAGTEDTVYTIKAIDLLKGFTDVDSGDTLSVTGLTANHGLLVDNQNGTWAFTPDANYNGLVSLNYHVSDGHGDVAASQSFSLAAVNDPAVMSAESANLTETNTALTASGTLTISDVDSPANFVAQNNTAGNYGNFSIGTNGAWSYAMNGAHDEFKDGQHYLEHFDVASADGTHTAVDINIIGTNDAPFDIKWNAADWTSGDTLPGSNVTLGKVQVLDVDNPNEFTYALGADSSAGFTVNPNDGTIKTISGLANSTTYTLNIHAEDASHATYDETFNIITGKNSTENGLGNGGTPPINNGDDILYGADGKDTIFAGSGDDTLFGQNGDDELHGGAGNDVLTGGAGNDKFVFDTALVAGNIDTVTDFSHSGTNGTDTIQLASAIFTGLGGAITSDEIWNGTGTQDANDRLIYNPNDGKLYFDADANGAGVAVQFAQLHVGTVLTAADFILA